MAFHNNFFQRFSIIYWSSSDVYVRNSFCKKSYFKSRYKKKTNGAHVNTNGKSQTSQLSQPDPSQTKTAAEDKNDNLHNLAGTCCFPLEPGQGQHQSKHHSVVKVIVYNHIIFKAWNPETDEFVTLPLRAITFYTTLQNHICTTLSNFTEPMNHTQTFLNGMQIQVFKEYLYSGVPMYQRSSIIN
ncbi:MAG: hypothetical protein M3P08_07535 [Thermoproteota archaeon]|nr:hypothetical protein [Thermoproteota archaeon]